MISTLRSSSFVLRTFWVEIAWGWKVTGHHHNVFHFHHQYQVQNHFTFSQNIWKERREKKKQIILFSTWFFTFTSQYFNSKLNVIRNKAESMKSMQCLFYDLKFKYPNALQKCTEQGRDRQTTSSKEAYSFSTRTGKPILLS